MFSPASAMPSSPSAIYINSSNPNQQPLSLPQAAPRPFTLSRAIASNPAADLSLPSASISTGGAASHPSVPLQKVTIDPGVSSRVLSMAAASAGAFQPAYMEAGNAASTLNTAPNSSSVDSFGINSDASFPSGASLGYPSPPTTPTAMDSPTLFKAPLAINLSGPAIDLSKMSPTDLTSFKELLRSQLLQRAKRFGCLAELYSVLFYFFTATSIISTTLIIVMLNTPVEYTLISSILSIVSTVAIAISTQFQLKLNAAYFAQAKNSYELAERETWFDVNSALQLQLMLDQKYDDNGFGTLFSPTTRTNAPLSPGATSKSGSAPITSVQAKNGLPAETAPTALDLMCMNRGQKLVF